MANREELQETEKQREREREKNSSYQPALIMMMICHFLSLQLRLFLCSLTLSPFYVPHVAHGIFCDKFKSRMFLLNRIQTVFKTNNKNLIRLD